VGTSGSARNSNIPRETATAPLILPLAWTSGGSRTSTISKSASLIIFRTSSGRSRGTAAFAAAIISLTLVGIDSISLSSGPVLWCQSHIGHAVASLARSEILSYYRLDFKKGGQTWFSHIPPLV
jgi:hypothetical protein